MNEGAQVSDEIDVVIAMPDGDGEDRVVEVEVEVGGEESKDSDE